MATTPKTDPTVLTTDALHREVANIVHKIDTAFEANNSLIDQKFGEVNRQFAIIERYRLEQKEDVRLAVAEQKRDTHTAVSAALSAVKDSNLKNETDVNAKLDAITANVTAPIIDLKERMARYESNRSGLLAGGAMLVAVAAIIIRLI